MGTVATDALFPRVTLSRTARKINDIVVCNIFNGAKHGACRFRYSITLKQYTVEIVAATHEREKIVYGYRAKNKK